jgi:predicted house-cleaning noncanonical NTP pyrophosphatase (MazG superfamily)
MIEYLVMIKTHCFKFDKLIRDRLPEILRQSGVKVMQRIMTHEEYIASLKDKLLEEAEEVCEATSKDELLEELGDVFEVIITIAHNEGFKLEDIINIAEKKRNQRGGFMEKAYVDSVELKSDNPIIKHYQASPAKYPEIK